MNIIILGDKFQKRMKSKGCVGLIKIDNKTILEHQIKYLNHTFKHANIVYIYGFDSKRFMNLSSKILSTKNLIPIYNEFYDTYNNAYSLSLAHEYLNDDCLILFGENFVGHKTLEKFNVNNGSQIFIASQNKNRLGCTINQGRVEHICFDLDNYLYEIYYLSKDHAKQLQDLVREPKLYNCFLFELINRLICNNCILKPFILDTRYALKTIS